MTSIIQPAKPAPAAVPETPALAGPNVLLMGPAGTGKTHSIGTIVEAGLPVFYLGLENGLESLVGYFTDRGKPVPPNLHWHIVAPPKASFAEGLAMAQSVNQLTFEGVSKFTDPNKQKYDQFLSIYKALNNFTCQRTGEVFGAVDSWPAHYVLVIDGLTGLNTASMANVIGGKTVRNQADWSVAQQQVLGLLRKLCDGCPCWFILLGHVERETDQVMGGVKLMPSTLGKALAPQIPALFSDVILTVREGTNWTWDTANPMADLKTRNLQYAAKQPPTFANILSKWKSRGGAVPSEVS